MAFVLGFVMALAAGAYATALRLDRDRAFYPTVMIVIAFYYVLFAVMGGSSRALVVESLIAGVFVLAASIGFRSSLWLVAAALAAHGLQDFVHARLVVNPGVPAWWPAWCGAYDVAAAGYLAWRLTRSESTIARRVALEHPIEAR
jgi:hypothetical protein